MMLKNQSSQPVRHLTHRRLTAVFFYLAILISVMVSLPIMVAPRQGLADANPELIVLQPMAQVSAGMAHSVFLDYDGLVYAWGDNAYGQSGSSGEDHTRIPVQLELPEPAQAISVGDYHTLILGQSGTVYALGRNAYGQGGDGGVANVDSRSKWRACQLSRPSPPAPIIPWLWARTAASGPGATIPRDKSGCRIRGGPRD
jgi:hypothetical protein